MGGGGRGGRSPCCDKSKVKKGPWSPAEDVRLVSFIQKHGHPNWRSLPKQAGLLRCGKSCRLRWINYLRPDVKRGNFTPQEEHSIIHLHAIFGNKWSKIASELPGRTDNEIKNVWNTHLKKRSSAATTMTNIKQNQEISSSHQPSTPTSCNNNELDDQDKMGFISGQHEAIIDKNRLESEVDQFWDMLDDIQLHDDVQMEVDKWLRLLEEELGLAVAPTPATACSNQQLQDDDDQISKIKSKDDNINDKQMASVIGYNPADYMWCDQISPTS